MGSGPNEALMVLLEAVGWRPEGLARRVNAELALRPGERRFVHEKTPYGWLRRGEVPRGSIPHVVVDVFAEAIGEPLAFEQVWPGAAARPSLWVPANHGMDVAWNQSGTVELLHGWVATMLRRRGFTAISGAALTLPAWQWLDAGAPPASAISQSNSAGISASLASTIEHNVAHMRHLGDFEGGSPETLRYVGDHFAALARLLQEASYSAAVGKRLFASLAELGHLAGFMAFDAGQDGLAQRYFLAGLRAAHSAGDRGMAVNILGIMAWQAAYRGRANDALQLAEVGERGADRLTPGVRAMAASRLAYASASVGDIGGFERARDRARELIALAEPCADHEPDWAYWVTSAAMEAHAGHALVLLAPKVLGRAPRLLAEADSLLTPWAMTPRTTGGQRLALLDGVWLSLLQARAREWGRVIEVGRTALARLPLVNSPRCVDLFRQLRRELTAPARKDPKVREFTADLDHMLPAA